MRTFLVAIFVLPLIGCGKDEPSPAPVGELVCERAISPQMLDWPDGVARKTAIYYCEKNGDFCTKYVYVNDETMTFGTCP